MRACTYDDIDEQEEMTDTPREPSVPLEVVELVAPLREDPDERQQQSV